MSNARGETAGGARPTVRGRPVGVGAIAPLVTIVVGALAVLVALAELWSRVLWVETVGASGVLWTQVRAQTELFGAGGLAAGGFCAACLHMVRSGRALPPVSLPARRAPWGPVASGTVEPSSAVPQRLVSLEPAGRFLRPALPVVVGVLVGAVAASRWRTFLLWQHRHPFGVVDPVLHCDVSFVVVELPWWQLVLDLSLVTLVLAAVLALGAHVVQGTVRVGPGARSSAMAVTQLACLAAAMALVQAGRFWLDRYALGSQDLTAPAGAEFAVLHGALPGRAMLSGACVVVAVLCLVPFVTGSWRVLAAAALALAVCVLIVGSAYPMTLQGAHRGDGVSAASTARARDAVRVAYGMTHVEHVPFDSSALRERGTGSALEGARVPLLDASLPGALAAGSPGRSGGAVVPLAGADAVVRVGDARAEASSVPVAAFATDRFGSRGEPVAAHGLPAAVADVAPGLDGASVRAGGAGVALDSPGRRVAVAIALRDPGLLGRTGTLLDHRDPVDRVRRVAPFLTVDERPVAAVVGQRLVWVLDGYTTAAQYPGAPTVQLSEVRGRVATSVGARVGYVRDAVKAVVDAQDGGVHLFAWDDSDPLLAAWRDCFPGLIEPRAAFPKDLEGALPYPEGLMRAQRSVLSRHHALDGVTDATVWQIAGGAPVGSGPSGPVREVVQLPGDTTATRALVSTYAVGGRTIATLVADTAGPAGSVGRLRIVSAAPSSGAGSRDPDPAGVLDAIKGSPARDRQGRSLADLASRRGSSLGSPMPVPTRRGLVHVVPLWTTDGARGPRLGGVAVVAGYVAAFGAGLDEAEVELDQSLARSGPGSDGPGVTARVRAAVARARQALDELDRAQRAGDLVRVAAAHRALETALREAAAATN